MVEKSKYVIALDQIQAKTHRFLKTRGFRKKGRTFNREADEKGIFQVINFQSGMFPIGEHYEIPGFRTSSSGTFTVNMGVLVKELYDMVEWHKPTNFYQEVYCQPRTRLPQLLGKKDAWWSFEGNLDATTDEIVLGLNTIGFEYFELYDTREKFINNYGRFDDAMPRAKLDVALVVMHADRPAGEKLFQEYFDQIDGKKGHPSHKKYVQELAEKLGVVLNGG